jgi:hypothetical protein
LTRRHPQVCCICSHPWSIFNICLVLWFSLGPPAQVSPAPTASSITQNSLQLSWTAPANNGGSSISGYRIEISISSGPYNTYLDNTLSAATARSIAGLTPSTTYNFRLAAINANGQGPLSAASLGVTTLAMTSSTQQGSSTGNKFALKMPLLLRIVRQINLLRRYLCNVCHTNTFDTFISIEMVLHNSSVLLFTLCSNRCTWFYFLFNRNTASTTQL